MRMWVLVAALLGLPLVAGCAGEEKIVHQLEEYEANEIIVVLEARGIKAAKVSEEGRVVTYSVQVSAVDVRDAMRILVANRLPRQRPQGLKEVYPAGGGGLIPTKSEERAKYLMALQGEVERKLLNLPGIVRAHVSIVQPEKDIVRDLDKEPPPSTASVAIVYNAIDERGTSAVTADEVRALVAASVEELKVTNVQVVMKKNVPANLVEVPFDTGNVEAPVAALKVFGVGVADKKSAQALQLYALVLGGAALLGIAVGIGGIVRSSSLKRRAQKSEAELTSLRKAGRATQTGLQQPPG
jgi:type III secretion protein J